MAGSRLLKRLRTSVLANKASRSLVQPGSIPQRKHASLLGREEGLARAVLYAVTQKVSQPRPEVRTGSIA